MSEAQRLPLLMLGDNQFFGVNHMSEARAREQLIRFQDLDAILDVLADAVDLGITTFMCTTHDRIGEVVKRAQADPARFEALDFHPCMPYAHKYANSVTEHGIVGTIQRFLPDDGLLGTALRGSKALAGGDLDGLAGLLIDAELSMFAGSRTPVVWMQNVVVDLLVGLGFHDALRQFAAHVESAYDAQAGFITMSLPQTLDALATAGVANPLVCANINKLGFRMPGGIETYQRLLQERPFRAVAMSVFASGAIPADEAIHWLAEQPHIESIVFGASRRATMSSTTALVNRYFADRDAAVLPAGSSASAAPGGAHGTADAKVGV